jgi:DNA gyrase subunit B
MDTEEGKPNQESSSYGEDSIRTLEGLELIRCRPTLFIDGMDSDGLHRLVSEAVDNAVDEFSSGYGRGISVTIHHDGAVEVADNGRGIPLGDHPEISTPIAAVLLTKVFAGAKFDGESYGSSGGLHGVGLKCINAFSSRLELVTSRPPSSKKFVFESGELASMEEAESKESGVRLKFWPDYALFGGATLDEERIAARLEDLSFLNPGLTIRMEGRSRSETFCSENGVPALLESKGCTNVFSCRTASPAAEVECHLGETPQGDTLSASYANGIPTTEGGSHLQGAKTGIARAATAYASRKKMLKESDPPITPSDVGEGCFLVVSVRAPHPPFSSQRKTRLNSPELELECASTLEPAFLTWLESSPTRARQVIQRMISSARAREKLMAMKVKLRMMMRARKNPRPHALMSAGPSPSEIWLGVRHPGWEKLSEEGRDVLPMRMRQNPPPPRTGLDKLLRHPDYFNLVSTLGAGVGSIEDDPEGGFQLERCRYKKVVVSSPPLSSARLAASFVMLFMERYLPGLLDSGRVHWSDGEKIAKVSLSQSIRGELESAAVAEEEEEGSHSREREESAPEEQDSTEEVILEEKS